MVIPEKKIITNEKDISYGASFHNYCLLHTVIPQSPWDPGSGTSPSLKIPKSADTQVSYTDWYIIFAYKLCTSSHILNLQKQPDFLFFFFLFLLAGHCSVSAVQTQPKVVSRPVLWNHCTTQNRPWWRLIRPRGRRDVLRAALPTATPAPGGCKLAVEGRKGSLGDSASALTSLLPTGGPQWCWENSWVQGFLPTFPSSGPGGLSSAGCPACGCLHRSSSSLGIPPDSAWVHKIGCKLSAPSFCFYLSLGLAILLFTSSCFQNSDSCYRRALRFQTAWQTDERSEFSVKYI